MLEPGPTSRFHLRFFFVSLFCHSFISSSCLSLNHEGKALTKLRQGVVRDPYGALTGWRKEDDDDHCSWFGVECSLEGRVVILDLRDLCLEGTLAPEIGDLVHLKSILLRNNCFTGEVPDAIGELKELEVLDLRYNNFISPHPRDLGRINRQSSRPIGRYTTWNVEATENAVPKRKLQAAAKQPPNQTTRTDAFLRGHPTTDAPVPAPSPPSNASAPSPDNSSSTNPTENGSSPSPFNSTANRSRSSKNHSAIIAGVVGGISFLVISAVVCFCATNKATVRPWATGISGQLQKALTTGVPKLKRSELQASCEDFSNVIGASAIGTLYKGTLSSGVEIAVASVDITSAKDWPASLENQFRKKIETLSKVNHKNFVNLIGYCEENEPFTRMLVFEYAPNGTLFEHLHIKESEHLDWQMRLRIAMGMAYCLDNMHQLNPPVVHPNLNSSSVYLTEDYAAKISDLSFSRETIPTDIESSKENVVEEQLPRPESNVYSFGVLLVEMITGRLPYTLHTDSLDDWASDYLRGDQPLKQMVDPTLTFFEDEKLERISELIRLCVHSDPERRPAMRDVTAILRDITALTPDASIPKLSPLWWAELEIMSPDAD